MGYQADPGQQQCAYPYAPCIVSMGFNSPNAETVERGEVQWGNAPVKGSGNDFAAASVAVLVRLSPDRAGGVSHQLGQSAVDA